MAITYYKMCKVRDEMSKLQAALDAKFEVSGKRTDWDFDYSFPKESGAIRRASMDLTRALAEMRRS